MNHNFKRRKNSIFHPAVISLMVISTLLNILLSMVVKAAGLPIYVDTVGTIVASALGGVVPGLLTAFATNVFKFLMDSESIFYLSINILIAVFSACYFVDFYFHYKKQRKKNKEMKRFSNIIVFDTDNAGISIECQTKVPKGTNNVYVAFTGNLCALMDIRIF